MDLEESLLRRTPDGGILCRLHNGIAIQRRKKHEPIKTTSLTRAEIVRLTDKVNGAKFKRGTSLRAIVQMTADVLIENDAQPGSKEPYNKVYPEAIGISRGRRVRALRVVRSQDGRLAHGYPVDERDL